MISIFNGRKRTLGGETSEIYAQIGVKFRDHLHHLKGARLAVFMAISLHANKNGWAWPSVSLLTKETGYNPSTINTALKDLCALTIKGERLLLKFQPKSKENGQFHSNHYLIFPSHAEVELYRNKGLQNTVNNLPSTENPVTVKPPDEEQPSLKKKQQYMAQERRQPTVDTAEETAVEQPTVEKAPPAPPVPTVAEMRAKNEAELSESLGSRTQAKAAPITSNGDWQARVRDNPHLRWGSESQELQRQVKRYGSASQPVLKLGYELEQAFGLRPPWSNRQKVKQWTAGLVSCLEEGEGDWLLVIDTARKMRNNGLTIKTPHSIVGMVGSAMAKRRSKQPTENDRIRQQMENDPQYQAGKIMYKIEQAEREAARVARENNNTNDEQA